MSYCHERGEEHDFDRVQGRMNAARHCRNCQAISLDWDDVEDEEEERVSLSSGHFSADQQLEDAASWIEHNAPADFAAFLTAFPEWPRRHMGFQVGASWFDTDAMGVDEEWGSWAIDWLEAHTAVYWEDGEPWVSED